MKRALAVAASVAAILFFLLQSVTAQTEQVTATVETDPVPAGDDAADDPAIWIHPTDPSLSTIIGTDKTGGGLAVYDLAGNELQYDGSVTPNNVDVRYGFPLGGHTVDLVGFSNVGDGTIGVYTVNPATRRVSNVAAGAIEPSFTPVGFCMYRSPVSDHFYAFAQSPDGEVEQWKLSDDGSGKVGGTLVRSFSVGSNSEGCVADDIYADLYIGEQEVALWKYGAEPNDGDNRTRIDTADGTGTITPDLEGLAIYYTSDGAGYLIASSQGSDEFVIYDRLTGAHVGTFQIVANGVDGVTHTDGIDVTNFPLGSDFPEGVFVAQDDDNPNGNQNFKYVPWGRIARAFGPNLTVDTDFNPRGGGGGPGTVREIPVARGIGDAEELRFGAGEAVELSSRARPRSQEPDRRHPVHRGRYPSRGDRHRRIHPVHFGRGHHPGCLPHDRGAGGRSREEVQEQAARNQLAPADRRGPLLDAPRVVDGGGRRRRSAHARPRIDPPGDRGPERLVPGEPDRPDHHGQGQARSRVVRG